MNQNSIRIDKTVDSYEGNQNNREIGTKKNYYFLSFFLVVLGGVVWSTGSIIVRYMEELDHYRWQYLFYRGLTMSIMLIIYQATIFKYNVFKKLYDIGWNGVIGGVALGFASIFFVFSITSTTIAVTMFMIALGPLLTAFLSRIFLKEKIKVVTLISMLVSFLGCLILIGNEYAFGSIYGALLGFICSFLFSVYTVSIRWKAGIPKPRTTIIGGLITATFSFVYLFFISESLWSMPAINIFFSILHGVVVGAGLIMFMFGARYLAAAELVLLSLMEVVVGILWSWLPWIGINEAISTTTLIGGGLIINAILFRAIMLNEKKPFFKLKKKYQNGD